ncbi:hypothetical protein [Streptomyces sp. 8N616]|uniref:hypothetical protein n=1 Tax=Streptomyces sp. 8N616 TaxID=3457414 RepID=UPI003FD285A0
MDADEPHRARTDWTRVDGAKALLEPAENVPMDQDASVENAEVGRQGRWAFQMHTPGPNPFYV